MKRAVLLFMGIVVAGTYLWPGLREIGLVAFPGDLVTEVRGYRLHVPIGLSLLITAAIYGAWRLLEPRR
jgi:hypothetical protein